jgi:hypothetical protein
VPLPQIVIHHHKAVRAEGEEDQERNEIKIHDEIREKCILDDFLAKEKGC